MFESDKLWEQFLSEFLACLDSASDEQLKTAWRSEADRTTFYTGYVFKIISERLGLFPAYELFRIDFPLCVRTEDGINVPVICIESERVYTNWWDKNVLESL